MKKQIQKRFIIFSMLAFIGVFIFIFIFAVVDRMDHFLRAITFFWIFVLFVMMFFASWLLSKAAIRPIEKAWQRQLDFTADASHELRTPLAVFQSNLEILAEHQEETVASQQKWIQNLLLETERMNKLVEELLLLSRADTGQQRKHFCEVPLGILIMERVDAFTALAKLQGVELEYHMEGELILQGDADALSKLFSILLDNALKYMGRAGKVTILAKEQGRNINVTFSDDGVGMAKEHCEKIFERFYRVDKDRSRRQGGSGLGLAIAKSVVEQHGGKIKCISEENAGVTFKMRFPKQKG